MGVQLSCYLKPQEAREMSQLAQEIGRRLRSIIANEETTGMRPVHSSYPRLP
jgi:hypothetical protein